MAEDIKYKGVNQLCRFHTVDVLPHFVIGGSNSLKLGCHMSHLVEKTTMWFPNRSDTNRPVQLQKQARSLKFWS